ncbi:hypothetical protein N7466_008316 [Penicillium verhagenii]|uniref:uncharacterized protein n=1 Tax=Penicillium verhagenii TaxID=1562060 RepID=UPI0025458999|nr:uncharacterized protein N7466_008316 [Penicillium verhagenii]KAJ5924129.1 hypothetical protein N7466_008316 [Penicillium verhagenii]
MTLSRTEISRTPSRQTRLIPAEIILKSLSTPNRKAKLKRKRATGRSGMPVAAEPPCSSESPPPRRLSMLEALPVELIEKIFLASPDVNINLPRASPVLAAALSSERVYRLLILYAFWEDPTTDQTDYPQDHPGSSYRGSPTIRNAFKPLDYVKLNWSQRENLQRLVFSCIWCTMDRILNQVPTLINLTIQRQWLDEGVKMDPVEREELQRFMDRKQDSKLEFNGSGPTTTQILERTGMSYSLFTQAYNHHPNMPKNSYKLLITPMADVEITHTRSGIVLNWPALNVCYFPKKLLRGSKTGFTPKDVAFLEMLRISSANFKRSNTKCAPCTLTNMDRSTLMEGVTKAIQTQNYNAMISLLKLDEFIFRWKYANNGEPVFYTIPSKHFEHVTRVGRDKPHLNQAFFEALVRTSAESVPSDSADITQWIIDNVERFQRDPNAYNRRAALFSKWLSDFTLKAPVFNQFDPFDDLEDQLFFCGELMFDHYEANYFAEVVLAPHRNSFGNWHEETTFRTTDRWVV